MRWRGERVLFGKAHLKSRKDRGGRMLYFRSGGGKKRSGTEERSRKVSEKLLFGS